MIYQQIEDGNDHFKKMKKAVMNNGLTVKIRIETSEIMCKFIHELN